MSNKDNLIPGQHQLTQEERSRGGLSRAKALKERREINSLARSILDMPLHNDNLIDAEDLPSLKDIESANVDVKTKIIATLAVKALNGNVRATETLLTLSGDYVTRQETTIDIENTLYDPDRTEYIQTVNVLVADGSDSNKDSQGKPSEVRYYDYDGNLAKVIYGEEAEKITKKDYDAKFRAGIPIQFDVVIDEED